MIEKKTSENIINELLQLNNKGLKLMCPSIEFKKGKDKLWISEDSLIEEFIKFKKWVLETTYGDYTIQLEQYFDKFQKELESVKEK